MTYIQCIQQSSKEKIEKNNNKKLKCINYSTVSCWYYPSCASPFLWLILARCKMSNFPATHTYSFMLSIFSLLTATALIHLAFDLTSCKLLNNFISVFAAVNGQILRSTESLQLALMPILETWYIHFTVARLHVTRCILT